MERWPTTEMLIINRSAIKIATIKRSGTKTLTLQWLAKEIILFNRCFFQKIYECYLCMYWLSNGLVASPDLT